MSALLFALALAAQPVPTRTPSTAEVLEAYPADGRFEQLAGDVTLACQVVNGRLANCEVAKETPVEKGFGDVAIKLASLYEYPAGATGPVTVDLHFDPPPMSAVQKFAVPLTILVLIIGGIALWFRRKRPSGTGAIGAKSP